MRVERGRRVFGYTVAIYRQTKVLTCLQRLGPQTREEIQLRTNLSPDRVRDALRDLLLHDRIQVTSKVRGAARGRLRYVYEAVCTS